MYRSKIEWCDSTLNIITGCRHDCPYCYVRQMTRRFSGNIRRNVVDREKFRKQGDLYILDRKFKDESGSVVHYPFGFEPTFYRYRLGTVLPKLKMGRNIFVGALGDMFGEWIPDEWIYEVIEECQKYPQHTYLFLTKNIDRYRRLSLPEKELNMFFGATITKEDEMHKINFLPSFNYTFVSLEPILEDLKPENYSTMFRQVDWVIIGAETGRRKDKVIPKKEWIESIVYQCEKHSTPVFMKDSLIAIMGEQNMLRNFPDGLQRKEMSPRLRNHLKSQCIVCKQELPKNQLVTLGANIQRGTGYKRFAWMCKECFFTFCRKHGCKIPEIKGLENMQIDKGGKSDGK